MTSISQIQAVSPAPRKDRSSDRALERYQRIRRATVLVTALALSGAMLFGRSTLPDIYHEPLELFGVMLMVTGIGGRLWSTLYIGGRKSAEVVETGPYSVTRNPLYLFNAVAAAGAGAQLGSIMAMVGFGALCAVGFYIVVLREEEFLRARLGRPYEDYCARVPRFLPDFRLYRDQAEVTFRPRLLRNTLRDGLVVFLALPLFETIEVAQDAGVLPVLCHMW